MGLIAGGFFPTNQGGVEAVLTLTTLVTSDFDLSPSPWQSTVGLRVATNGEVLEQTFNTYIPQNAGTEWINDGGATASEYEVRVVKTSGTNNIQPNNLGSWLALTVTRTFSDNNVTIEGNYSWLGTVEIREIANTSNTTGTISLTMTVDNGEA